jgi:protein gp37
MLFVGLASFPERKLKTNNRRPNAGKLNLLMQNTNIQWSDDTCNPVMGCDGCELWPKQSAIISQMIQLIISKTDQTRQHVSQMIKTVADTFVDIPKKDTIRLTIEAVAPTFKLGLGDRVEIIRETRGLLKCYAGNLTSNRDGGRVKGYPPSFDIPTPFPGRMAKAAVARDLRGMDRSDKPWLNGYPRTIFVSDMGDALSEGITFDFLKTEIIDIASSEKGRRHLWLWLTKRPHRMAEFLLCLEREGIAFPDNIVGMTSVTSSKTVRRAEQLQKVKCRMRGLSVEPLWRPVTLPLEGIDWVIVGGESGARDYAETFDLAWARDIREQCRKAGVAFFVKQLGTRPVENGVPLKLHNRHGGDWNEWPEDLRTREFPSVFLT